MSASDMDTYGLRVCDGGEHKQDKTKFFEHNLTYRKYDAPEPQQVRNEQPIAAQHAVRDSVLRDENDLCIDRLLLFEQHALLVPTPSAHRKA